MRPFELTAMPSTSPRFMSAEYLRKSGLESKGISGTVTGGGTVAAAAAGGCCANTKVGEVTPKAEIDATRTPDTNQNRFTTHLPQQWATGHATAARRTISLTRQPSFPARPGSPGSVAVDLQHRKQRRKITYSPAE